MADDATRKHPPMKKATRRWLFLHMCSASITWQQMREQQLQPEQQPERKQLQREPEQRPEPERVRELLLFCHKQPGQQQR